MPSIKSIKLFFIINGSLISIASVQHIILNYYNYNVLCIFLSAIVRLFTLLYILTKLTKNKDYITSGERTRTFNIVDFIKTASVETLSLFLLTNYYTNNSLSITQDLIYFIPRSFIFELIFDFGHYSTHRIIHSIPLLYRIVHKKHHSDYLINVDTSYNHTLSDYILTNTLPLLLTAYLLPSSRYFYSLIIWYKSFVEFAGHTGIDNKSGSFPQFKWLPQLLKISVYTRNHNKHHTHPNYNFAKRFSIWDKLFGTYSDISQPIINKN
jgi:sterol desaturase/sphingolipid hydroxylase (fatty acid hydroxylase superfamily)